MTAAAQTQLRDFLQRYKAIQTIADRANEKIERLTATRFSVFDYCRPDEMALSRLMAGLLEPRGRHGQQELFLKLFVNGLNRKLALTGQDYLPTLDLQRTVIKTEVATSHIENTRRRIDILLVNPNWALAVENKPWAVEQVDQLADYQNHLKAKYCDRRRELIYLSGNYSPPTTEAPGQRAIRMGYHRGDLAGERHYFLSDWLAEARDRCPADKVRHFLTDLSQWVAANFQPTLNLEDEGKGNA